MRGPRPLRDVSTRRDAWPHDEGLELALLGTMMDRPELLDRSEVNADLFYVPNHRIFYRALKARRDAGEATNWPFMIRPLVDEGIPESSRLAERAAELVFSSLPHDVIRDLARLAARRHYIHDAELLSRLAREGDLDAETLGTLHDRMGEMLQGAQGRRAPRFRILDAEAVANLPPPAWLVDGILPEGFSVLYGPSGCGKTFFALGIALSIASGLRWFDRGVKRGAVAYVAAEGVVGLGVRLRAWQEWTQLTAPPPVHFVTEAVNLLEREAVEALGAQLRPLRGDLRLLVVDTWARCLIGGDENNAGDTGRAISHLDRLRNDLQCSVVVVHHTGKTGDLERGSSALRGAADMMLSVQADASELTVRCEKPKDSAAFDDLRLCLRTVEIGGSDSSCVVDVVAATSDAVGASRAAIQALEALVNGFDEEGATFTQWCKVADQPERSFARYREDLRRARLVEKVGTGRGARYVVTDAGRALTARCQVAANGANGTGPGRPATGASAYRAGTVAAWGQG